MSRTTAPGRACGRVILFTGTGKGKTTAALGLALRAMGHGLRVCIIQFIKSRTDVGEVIALKRLRGRCEVHTTGWGFVRKPGGAPRDRSAAAGALALARRKALECDLLILDEVLCAVKAGLVSPADVLDLIDSRPPALHLVLTGRDAHPDLVQAADTATDMRCIRHHGEGGGAAVPGIEF